MIHDAYLSHYRAGKEGLSWYRDTSSQILTAAADLSIRPEYLAGLAACFSIRTSVRRSCIWTLHWLKHRAFLDDVPRPVRTSVHHFEDTGLVKGRKIEPFSRALLGDPEAVVIDTHMLRAASLPPKANKTDFEAALAAVHSVAHRRTSPAAAQAAIWTGYMRSIGRNPPGFPLLELLETSP